MAADDKQVESSTEPHHFHMVPSGFSKTEFRVITHDNRRHALKLEQVFWKVLELAAAAKKQRLNEYVGELIATQRQQSNKTSAIRVHAAEWLSKRLIESSSKSLSTKSLVKLVQANAAPCFCIDLDNRFICQNAALAGYLRPAVDEADGLLNAVVKLTFKRDAEAVKSAVLRSTKSYIEEIVTITCGTQTTEHSARVYGLETTHGRLIGYFVLLPNGRGP